jgi:trans-2,3-dihydro-3-hydroxyanthranilate isomerase
VIKKSAKRFVFGLNIGPTPVDLEWADGRSELRMDDAAAADVRSDRDAARRVCRRAWSQADDLSDTLPVQEVSCGVPYLVVALRDHAAVDRAVTDSAGFGRLCAACGLDLPIFLFSVGGPSPDDNVYGACSRPTSASSKIPRPGARPAPSAAMSFITVLVKADPARPIQISQGVAMGRPSRIYVSVEGEAKDITGVKVGGTAILVGRGELLV